MPSSPGIRNATLPPGPSTAPRADRRDIQRRLLAEGPGRLSDAELLSLAWGLGTRRAPPPLRAAALLEQFGGMGGLFAAPQKQLARAGLGPAAWSVLQAALELARRSVAQHLRQGKLRAQPAPVGAESADGDLLLDRCAQALCNRFPVFADIRQYPVTQREYGCSEYETDSQNQPRQYAIDPQRTDLDPVADCGKAHVRPEKL
jgi:hypothetical protein